MRGLPVLIALCLAANSFGATENNSSQNLFDAQQVPINKAENLERYLSALKRQSLIYSYKNVDEQSKKLRDAWIQPIRLNFSLSRQNPYNEQVSTSTEVETQNAAIAIDQPIFQSGGIIYGIKFASASREFATYSVDQQRRSLIKSAVTLLMQVKKAELAAQKQKLQVENAQINMEQLQQRYINGEVDSGQLDSAIIEKNRAEQVYYDLQTAFERVVSRFEAISDLDYKTAPIPFLALIDEKSFMEQNIDLDLRRAEAKKERYNAHVTLAKYLPKISLQGSYNWQKSESFFFINGNPVNAAAPETTFYRYGLTASIPLDINSKNDYESARLTFLQKEVEIDDTKRALKALYEQVTQNIKNFDNKIALAKRNRTLYKKLLVDSQSLYNIGYKTQYDLQTLKNSSAIQEMDMKIFAIDKQLELLDLYEKLSR